MPKANTQCSEDDCDKRAYRRGLCSTHYRLDRAADPATPRCCEDECQRPVRAALRCELHYQRWRNRSDGQGRLIRGVDHPNWRGGEHVNGEGYVKVTLYPGDEFYTGTGGRQRVSKHRLVMQQALGRLLGPHEEVHHIDDDKAHNDLSNLQLRIGRHGKGVAVQCCDCGSRNVAVTPL
jgi:hypothetical protein